MRSNYKRLGDYIRQVDVRNKDLVTTNLLGISINKYFMPSVANVIGTDLTKYKLIEKNQFACNPMHVGRDGRLPVALFSTEELAIVSPAYFMFEITDPNLLLSEYLMMWFMRPEFDRYCTFKTDSSVRGGIEWSEICDVTLPVPDIKVQQQIVDEYNVVKERIDLNGRLIKTLEETAQAIYKQWFVNFEFPDENGKPYRSSGGKMIDSELGEIPEGWKVGTLRDVCEMYDNMRKPLSSLERVSMQKLYPYYGAASLIDFVQDYIFDGTYILLSEDGANIIDDKGYPLLQYVWGRFWVNNHAHILKGKGGHSVESIYLLLKTINMSSIVTGAAQPKISQANLLSLPTLLARKDMLNIFNTVVDKLFFAYRVYSEQITISGNLLELLLSKLATVEG